MKSILKIKSLNLSSSSNTSPDNTKPLSLKACLARIALGAILASPVIAFANSADNGASGGTITFSGMIVEGTCDFDSEYVKSDACFNSAINQKVVNQFLNSAKTNSTDLMKSLERNSFSDFSVIGTPNQRILSITYR